MAGFEYKVVPAPTKGVKAKGVRTAEDRFAHTLQALMNSLGAEGWEYQRTDTLPATERAGLTGSQTVWRHVLVFRRAAMPVADTGPEAPAAEPLKLEDKTKAAEAQTPAPDTDAPRSEADVEHSAPDTASKTPAPETPAPKTPTPEEPATAELAVDIPTPDKPRTNTDAERPAGQPGATQMLRDNGVEETSDVAGPSASLSALAKNRKGPFDSGV